MTDREDGASLGQLSDARRESQEAVSAGHGTLAQVAGTRTCLRAAGSGVQIPSPLGNIAGQIPDSGGRYSLQIGARATGQHQRGKRSAVACDDVKNPSRRSATEEFTSSVSKSRPSRAPRG